MNGSNRPDAGDEAFVRQLKSVLDAGNAHLDGHVRSRLTRARHAALEQARPAPAFWARQWAPAAGVAAAAVLAVLLWPGARQSSTIDAQVVDEAGPNDLEIVFAEENLDLLEDLDFYEWVDAEAGSI